MSDQAVLYRFTDRLYRAISLGQIYEASLDAILEALGCDRASVLLFDASGVMRFVAWRGLSDTYRLAVDGHSPWKSGERDPSPIFITDIDACAEVDALRAVIRGEGIRALGFIPLVADGVTIGKFMTYYETPHNFTDGEVEMALTIARQLGFSIERNRAERERRQTQEELRRRAEEFLTLADNIPTLCWMAQADGHIHWFNRRWYEYTGTEATSQEGWGWQSVHDPDVLPHVVERWKQSLATGEPFEMTFPIRGSDGIFRPFLTRVVPIRDAAGRIVRWFGTNVDISELKRAEEQRVLLINELNHRVKNTLATVQSLAFQTWRSRTGDDDAYERFQARLMALARAHDVVTHESWAGAELLDLVQRILEPFQPTAGRFSITGAPVRLTPKQALALAMSLHELATNAAKYGALSNQSGRIAVSWLIAQEGQADALHLNWTEQGGPLVTAPARRGFGTRLIERSLGDELEGEAMLDFQPTGLVASLAIPLFRDTVPGHPRGVVVTAA